MKAAADMNFHSASAERSEFSSRLARNRVKVSYRAVGVLVATAEMLVIIAGSVIGPLAYGWIFNVKPSPLNIALGAGVLSAILYVSIVRNVSLYTLPTLIDVGRHSRRIFASCGLVLLSLTAGLFVFKIGSVVSRGAMLLFAAAMLLLCWLTRLVAATVIRRLIQRDSIVGRPSFLIGEPDEMDSLTDHFLLLNFGLQEVGRSALCQSVASSDDYRHSLNDAMEAARLSPAKELIVAAKFDSLDHLAAIEQALRASPLPARLVPNHIYRSVMLRHASDQDARFHLIDLQRAPLSRSEQITKRTIDVVVAAIGLVILTPILIAVAFLIKLDSKGPIIFRQRRNGFNRRQFAILKFRTMTVLEDGDDIVQAQPGDARVTSVGRVLRRTSLDEFPQLWNVLKGNMSLVGPRPHALAHDNVYSEIIGDYSRRHHVKPGMTGWAQVNGFRGETIGSKQMQARIDLDLWYINNWSIRLDIWILMRTALEVLKQNAY